MYRLSALAGLMLSGMALAAPLPQESRVPGGIALVPLPAGSAADTTAYFGERQIWVLPDDKGGRVAVVGIPLNAKEKITLHFKSGSSDTEVAVAISPKQYAEQHLTLKNQNYVNPSQEELDRYKREAAEQAAVYTTFNGKTESWPEFHLPIKGTVITSSFGLQRFFNGEPRAPHSGLDITAPEGKEAMAPAAGVVVQTGAYFFNGNTVMIDHGNGLVSMLCHLSKITAKKGDTVKAGDVVGLVGHTGRATGPHLHWGVSLNDARVDPLLVFPAGTPTPPKDTPDTP